MNRVKYYIILLFTSLISCSIPINKNKFIQGDWYYFSGEKNIYTEIYFEDTSMQWTTAVTDIPPTKFVIKNDSILGDIFNYGYFERKLCAKIEIMNDFSFKIINDSTTIVLYRVDVNEYTYSNYIKDWKSLDKLSKNQRDSVYGVIWKKQTYGIKERDVLARIKHNLISKDSVLTYLDECIKANANNLENKQFCTSIKNKVERKH